MAPGISAQYRNPLLGISTQSLKAHWSQTRENSSPELLQLVTVGCMFRYNLEFLIFVDDICRLDVEMEMMGKQ